MHSQYNNRLNNVVSEKSDIMCIIQNIPVALLILLPQPPPPPPHPYQVSRTLAVHDNLEEYGDVMTDAVSFAVTRSGTSIARLEDIRSLPLSKKIFYGLCEAPVILLVRKISQIFHIRFNHVNIYYYNYIPLYTHT